MPRPRRADVADTVYHVINRGNRRSVLFEETSDYMAFEELLEDIVLVRGMRIIAYCIMPNHWHLVLYPRHDGQLAEVLQWLTTTHVRRWHRDKHTIGGGHLYQGRYKSFPVETNEYLLQLIRYVEQNPLRANLVKRAEEWKYSSLKWRVTQPCLWLADPIVSLPEKYLAWINEEDTELDRLRTCVNTGTPFGSDQWMEQCMRSTSGT